MSLVLTQPSLHPTWEYWRGLLQPGWSPYGNTARLLRREPASAHSETLLLRPFRRLADWAPGQHLTVGFELDGRRYQRSFTLTSLPGERDLALTVRKLPGGRFAGWLQQAERGARLAISEPWGGIAFECPDAPRRLLLAAGSGITAAMAQVRAAAERGQAAGLALAYWVQERAQACFIEELQALQKRVPEFRFQLHLTGETASAAHERSGRFDEQSLAALPADPTGAEVLACGPTGFVAKVEALLRDAARRVATESFTPPLQRAVQSDEAGMVMLELRRSGRRLPVAAGTSLLAALEAAGLKPEHGCRQGLCGRCVCAKSEGVHLDLRDGSLHAEPGGAVKLCVSAARSDLVLDL